jgi:DUF438 domain-containing protein
MNSSQIDLEKLMDEIPIALTFVNSEGTILYRNRTAAERPTPGPRDVGRNIRDCHALPKSLDMIEKIFNDFKTGRKTPHRYISQRLKARELVTLIPILKEDRFEGCLSVVHPLEIEEAPRTF